MSAQTRAHTHTHTRVGFADGNILVLESRSSRKTVRVLHEEVDGKGWHGQECKIIITIATCKGS